MSARIIDYAKADEPGDLHATVQEAEHRLSGMLDAFRSRGYSVEKLQVDGESRPRYRVIDQNQFWIGTYAIVDD